MDSPCENMDSDDKIWMGEKYDRYWIRRNPEDTLSLEGVVTYCKPPLILKLSPYLLAKLSHSGSPWEAFSKKRKRHLTELSNEFNKKLNEMEKADDEVAKNMQKEYDTECTSWIKLRDEQEEKIDKLIDLINHDEEEKEKLSTRIRHLESDLAKERGDNLRFSVENKKLRTAAASDRTEKERLLCELETSKSEYDKLKAHAALQKSEKESLEKDLEASKSAQDLKQKENDHLLQHNNGLKTEVHELQYGSKIGSRASQMIEERDEEIENLHKKFDAKDATIKGQRNRLTANKERIISLETMIGEKQSDTQRLKEMVEDNEKRLKDAQAKATKVDEKDRNIRDLRQKISEKDKEIAKFRKKTDMLRKSFDEYFEKD